MRLRSFQYDYFCGHNAKDIAPSIAWKERHGKRLDDPRRSSLKGRKRAIVSQSNIGTVSRETFGETSERRGRAHMGFSDHRDTYHLELNSISLAITASSKGGSSMAQSISVCEFIILLLRKEAR